MNTTKRIAEVERSYRTQSARGRTSRMKCRWPECSLLSVDAISGWHCGAHALALDDDHAEAITDDLARD